jgi:hypothetical protein
LFFHVSIFPTKLCQTSQGCGDSDRNKERPVTNIFQGEWGWINSQCNKVLELGDQNLNLDRRFERPPSPSSHLKTKKDFGKIITIKIGISVEL